MPLQKSRYNTLIFACKDTAGGINNTSAGLEQASGGAQDVCLLDHQFNNTFRTLPHLEVGIAPERAQSTAGRID